MSQSQTMASNAYEIDVAADCGAIISIISAIAKLVAELHECLWLKEARPVLSADLFGWVP